MDTRRLSYETYLLKRLVGLRSRPTEGLELEGPAENVQNVLDRIMLDLRAAEISQLTHSDAAPSA